MPGFLAARGFFNTHRLVFQQVDDQTGEPLQGVDLAGIQLACLGVKHTHGTQRKTVVGDDGCARIKPCVRSACHQRVVAETRVLLKVFDHHHMALVEDGMSAKGHLPWGFMLNDAEARFEPLPILIDQADECHWRAADHLRQRGDVVKGLFWQRVEDAQAMESGQSLCLVGGGRGDLHGACSRGLQVVTQPPVLHTLHRAIYPAPSTSTHPPPAAMTPLTTTQQTCVVWCSA